MAQPLKARLTTNVKTLEYRSSSNIVLQPIKTAEAPGAPGLRFLGYLLHFVLRVQKLVKVLKAPSLV